jgi:hypothetical protein
VHAAIVLLDEVGVGLDQEDLEEVGMHEERQIVGGNGALKIEGNIPVGCAPDRSLSIEPARPGWSYWPRDSGGSTRRRVCEGCAALP